MAVAERRVHVGGGLVDGGGQERVAVPSAVALVLRGRAELLARHVPPRLDTADSRPRAALGHAPVRPSRAPDAAGRSIATTFLPALTELDPSADADAVRRGSEPALTPRALEAQPDTRAEIVAYAVEEGAHAALAKVEAAGGRPLEGGDAVGQLAVHVGATRPGRGRPPRRRPRAPTAGSPRSCGRPRRAPPRIESPSPQAAGSNVSMPPRPRPGRWRATSRSASGTGTGRSPSGRPGISSPAPSGDTNRPAPTPDREGRQDHVPGGGCF